MNRLELLIPPPVWFAFSWGAMWGLSKIDPFIIIIPGTSFLGKGFFVIGLGIALWAVARFLRQKTTINPHKPQKSARLVTGGIYRITRNPMYLGMVLILIGIALSYGSVLGAVIVPLFVVIITKLQIEPEERALEDLFGAAYLAYKEKVRRWI